MYNICKLCAYIIYRCFPGGTVAKNTPTNAGDAGDRGLIPGFGRCSGGGNGKWLQYFHLESPMDWGAWWATAHKVAKSWRQLSNWACTHHIQIYYTMHIMSKLYIYIYISVCIGIYRLPWWLRQWKTGLQCRRSGLSPWVGKVLWRREWLLTSVFLSTESQRQRSLAGYSPWGHKELDMTEQLNTYAHTHTYVCVYVYVYIYIYFM